MSCTHASELQLSFYESWFVYDTAPPKKSFLSYALVCNQGIRAGFYKQIEINIDYILMLVQKSHDTHCEDKEVLITIHKAIEASPELRSKKQLIENFIAGINDVDDVMTEWNGYVAEQREADLEAIIIAIFNNTADSTLTSGKK